MSYMVISLHSEKLSYPIFNTVLGTVTSLKAHPAKALSPISSNPSGRLSFVIPDSLNAYLPIVLVPSRIMVLRFLQPENALFPISVADNFTLFRLSQPANAAASIIEIASRLISSNASHLLNAMLEMVLTLFDNLIFLIALFPAKALSPIISTLSGTTNSASLKLDGTSTSFFISRLYKMPSKEQNTSFLSSTSIAENVGIIGAPLQGVSVTGNASNEITFTDEGMVIFSMDSHP